MGSEGGHQEAYRNSDRATGFMAEMGDAEQTTLKQSGRSFNGLMRTKAF